MKTLWIVTAVLLSGCGGHYEALSAGAVGCPPNQIVVTDFQQSSGGVCTWEASCHQQTFECTQNAASQVSCSPILGGTP